MPQELIHLLTEWHTVPVATTGPEGKPNVAAKSVIVMNPKTLVWRELYFMQTWENHKKDPRASICAGKEAPPFNACKINGRGNMHENDVITTQRDELMQTSHGMDFKSRREKLAAVHFTVEEIYDETPDIKAAGRQITL